MEEKEMARTSKTAAIGACVLAAMFMVSWPLAAQVSGDDQVLQPNVAGVTRFIYSGGAVEGVREVTENAPQTTTSTAFVNVTGATASWFVPAGDSDLINVLFTAECRLINSALSNTNQDWVEIRALLTRTPALVGFPTFMQPYDTTSVQAFCSANGWAMHAADWTARVSGGLTGATYTVQLQYKVTNNFPTANPGGVLSAWLDDWTLKLVAYN
jgi:hypothetical protein